MNKNFEVKLSKIIKKADNDTFHSYLDNFKFFKTEESDFVKDFEEEFKNMNLKNEWPALLRKLRYFDDDGIKMMLAKLSHLTIKYEKFNEVFKIGTEEGSFTIPSRLEMLNKIQLLADKLIYDIIPNIFGQLNFDAKLERTQSEFMKGTIDWNNTLLINFKNGDEIPRNFAIMMYKSQFNTTENKLVIFVLLKLKNEIEQILNTEFDKNIDLDKKEIKLLENITYQIEVIISNSKLIDLRNLIPVPEISKKKSKFMDNLLDGTRDRIANRIIINESYEKLINWLEEFEGFNLQSIVEKYSRFPITENKNIDTIYELWIIFEIANFFERRLCRLVEVTKNEHGEFRGFKFEYNKKNFFLNYQKTMYGWANKGTPDIVISTNNDKNEIIIDAKNWHNKDFSDAKYKMLGYLENFASNIGILYFISKNYKEERCDSKNTNKLLIIKRMRPIEPEKVNENLEELFQELKKVLA